MDELYYSQHLKDHARDAIKRLLSDITPCQGSDGVGMDAFTGMTFDTRTTDKGLTLIVTLSCMSAGAEMVSALTGKMEKLLSMPVYINFASSQAA